MGLAGDFPAPRASPKRAFSSLLILGLLVVGIVPLIQDLAAAQSAEQGRALFQEKGCAACHSIGGGPRVGPDLQGVTARRERAWLRRWIKEPDRVLAERDPIATQLLKQFNNVPMPNLRLTDEQVDAILAYLESLQLGPAKPALALPSLYVPTLIAALVAVAGLTAVGLLAARKTVEVRP